MKKLIAWLFLLGVVFTTFSPLSVFAQEEDEILQTVTSHSDAESETSVYERAKNKGNARGAILEFRNLSTDERKAAIAELKAKRLTERCLIVKENIENRQNFYKENAEEREQKYGAVKNRVDALISKLEKAEIDTTSIEGYSTELNSLITKTTTAKADFLAKLDEATNSACQQKQDDFKQAIATAKVSLRTFRDSHKAVHSYLKETYVPALRELLAELKTKSS